MTLPKPQEKKTYEKPVLTRYGTLKDVYKNSCLGMAQNESD